MSNGISPLQDAPSAVTNTSSQPRDHTPISQKANPPHAMSNGHIKDTMSHQSGTLRTTCADLNARVTRFLSAEPSGQIMRRTQEQTRVALSVIEKALQDYDFDALSISYNGGKDCLVLLILYLSALHTHITQHPSRRNPNDPTTTTVPSKTHTHNHTDSTTLNLDFPTSIPSIYAKPPDPFDSVTHFVDTSTQTYHLNLTHISTNPGPTPSPSNPSSSSSQTSNGTSSTTSDPPSQPSSSSSQPNEPIISFRDAFAIYLDQHPQIRAIFVGTRRTDPHGATLRHFQLTDGNWPRFMRIHPIIDWKLSEIWCFLRSEWLGPEGGGGEAKGTLEYCRMYDEGYTSLGGRGDTVRNPRLRYVDGDGQVRYKPAYEMTEDEEERAGRE